MMFSLTSGPYASAVSMRLTPSSTARRSTARAAARSLGSPQMPSPVIRIAPKPIGARPGHLRASSSRLRLRAVRWASGVLSARSTPGGTLGGGENGLGLLDAAPAEESQVLLLPPRGPDEEVLQLGPQSRREGEDVLGRVPVRRLQRSEEEPIVPLPSRALLPVLLHLEHAQQTRADDHPRRARLRGVEHRIQRIAVLGLRRRDEPPVERIVQPEGEGTAQRDVAQLGIELQLHSRAGR